MASPLDTLASTIYRGFRGRTFSGVLTRPVASSTKDAHGDAVPGTPLTYTFEGFTDEYSDATRARAGIPEDDLMLCIFAASMDVPPQQDDRAVLSGGPNSGQTLVIRSAKTDPAGALYTCRAYAE